MKRRVFLSSSLLLASTPHLHAQETYPSRPIRIIIPLGAGGIFDVIARSLADELARQLQVATVVENRPGGQFAIGLTALSSAKPDGYTIGLVSAAMLAQMPVLFPDLPYKLEDFQPVAPLADFRSVLAVPASSPTADLANYVAQAKSSTSPTLLGIVGIGGTAHLVMEQLAETAGFSIEPVSYTSEPAAVQALLGGHAPAAMLSVANAIEHYRAGKIRILGFSGTQRQPDLPTVPTFVEAGYPAVVGSSWVGVFAPVGTPPDIVNRLNTAVTTATRQPAFKQRLQVDMEPFSATPAELRELAVKDRARWGAIIRDRGLRAKVAKK